MREIISPAAALFIIALVCGACLGFIHGITEEPIKAAEAKSKTDALSSLMPDAAAFTPIDLSGSQTEFDNNAIVTESYTAEDMTGSILAYCIFAESKGYGGPVGILAVIDAETGGITGVSVVKTTETPGLGTLAGEDKFKNQFTGGRKPFTVTKTAPGDNEIAAISGATITSNAVTQAVNAALMYYSNIAR